MIVVGHSGLGIVRREVPAVASAVGRAIIVWVGMTGVVCVRAVHRIIDRGGG